ncbi:MAG: patatin-like phospholipase family protein [Defluviitaleaceae bacterium]|nr:patatin-like phospholipase family protein [Defluviitaleaceae bacterium]
MNLLNDPEVLELKKKLRSMAADESFAVSDLILKRGGETFQFVDLVMEGGGTLGIALIGYIHALEQANIRFLGVGGSSVGAIVALLLSCIGKRTEEKGTALAEIMTEMDMKSFIDGNIFAGALSKLLGSGNAGKKKLRIMLLSALSSGSVVKKLGLNPGDKFFEWLTSCIEKAGIFTMEDARKVTEYIPEEMTHRVNGDKFTKPSASLKLVAADLTTSSKVIFPEMAPLYWEEPDKVNPAYFARASMSIPGFFQPMEAHGISKITDVTEKWKNLCSFSGKIPDRIAFSDGGLLSNFPISLFHQSRVPNAPTFGARLGSYSRVVNEISSLGGYAGGLFGALRHYSDFDFIYQNPDYMRLITYIPTEGHNWLNFNMTDDEKLTLFKKGMSAACSFLENFEWETYKEIRREQHEHEKSMHRFGRFKPHGKNAK